jgi:hypothetical protein
MCFDFVFWASELFGSEPVRNRRLLNKCPKKIWVGSWAYFGSLQGKGGEVGLTLHSL